MENYDGARSRLRAISLRFVCHRTIVLQIHVKNTDMLRVFRFGKLEKRVKLNLHTVQSSFYFFFSSFTAFFFFFPFFASLSSLYPFRLLVFLPSSPFFLIFLLLLFLFFRMLFPLLFPLLFLSCLSLLFFPSSPAYIIFFLLFSSISHFFLSPSFLIFLFFFSSPS